MCHCPRRRPGLKEEGALIMSNPDIPENPLNSFIVAACVPLDSGHASGTLDQAEAIRAAHPGIATADIYTAAILGDEAALRRFLAENPANATAKGGPYRWDPLTYLCFSKYLRL